MGKVPKKAAENVLHAFILGNVHFTLHFHISKHDIATNTIEHYHKDTRMMCNTFVPLLHFHYFALIVTVCPLSYMNTSDTHYEISKSSFRSA